MGKFSLFLSNFLTESQQKVLLFLLLFFALGKGLQLFSYNTQITEQEHTKIEQALKIDAKIVIDVRTAEATELTMIPGIGEKTAAKIIALRSEFSCLEDLQMVKGIGPAKFAKMKEYFLPFGEKYQKKVVEEKKAEAEYDRQAELVNVNTAGMQDLMSINGIGKVTAKRIVDYRQKNGNFDSPKDLKKVKGIGPKKLEKILPQVMVK